MIETLAPKKKRSALWDTMPKPNQKILETLEADEIELDKQADEQKHHEQEVIRELGPEEGREKLIEEGMEMLLERLAAYEKYVEEVESWKEKARSKYVLLRKASAKKAD